jgi:EmrB/QacA subfamily drug resistance transporter
MIAVALPDIGRQLGLDLTVVQWVILIYLLVNSSTIAISGRVSELVGARLIYRVGLAAFGLGGLACALAPSLPILLAMRALQALGAGMFVVSVPVILTAAFPDEQRGRVLGLYATAVFIGISAGPLLGGAITEWIGWRGVFAGTMLLAAFALWLAWLYVPLEPRRAGHAAPFDLYGSLAYMGMLAPLLLALGRARQDGLGSPETLVLLAASALATAAFVVVELRTAAPMFDLRLFARRYFALSMLSSLTVFLSYYTVVFLMPFYLVQARGISPSLAGLLLSAYPIAMALVASPAGVLNDRIGSILPASVGAIGIGLALLMFSRVGPDTPYAYIVAALALVGAGAGLGDVSNNAAMMGAAPPARRGMASGVIATTRYIGQSLGVAFSSFIFTLAAGAEVGSQSLPGFTAAFLGMSAFAWLSLLTSLTRGKAPPRPSAP